MKLIPQGTHSLQLLSHPSILLHLPPDQGNAKLQSISACASVQKSYLCSQLLSSSPQMFETTYLIRRQLEGSYTHTPPPPPQFIHLVILLWLEFFVLFFSQPQNGGWPWWFAGLQCIGSVWVGSFLPANCTARGHDEASVQLTYLAEQRGADILCFKLTLGVGKWLWKRACFSKYWSTLLSVCHSLHVPVYDHAHHTARKTFLMLWMPGGQAAAVPLDGECGQCSHPVAPPVCYQDLAVPNLSSHSLLNFSCWWCPHQNHTL